MSAGSSGAWAIVLAGGERSRLRHLSVDGRGRPAPKQYCGFGSGRSLLRRALTRAERVAAPGRVMTVVDSSHERWWPAELAGRAPDGVVVQPANRGTAAGVLLPLVELWWRDPDATVAILPSDHGVRHEDVLAGTLGRALAEASRPAGGIVLLGITPDGPETSYGWIVPEPSGAGQRCRWVRQFVEKPELRMAQALFRGGALWSGFLLAGRVRALLDLYRRTLPQLLAAFLDQLRPGDASPESGERGAALHDFYRDLPAFDFSRDVLGAAPAALSVLAVPPCGWSDLGTPERLAAFLGVVPARHAVVPLHRIRREREQYEASHAGDRELAVGASP